MKTILILIVLCFNIVVIGQTKEVLVLTKKTKGKEVILEQGKKVKVLTTDGKVYKGNYLIRNDSLIIPEQASIAMNEISSLSKIPIGRKIIGGALTTVGGLTLLGTVDGMVTAVDDGWGAVAYLLFIPLEIIEVAAITTGVIFLSTGKRYKASLWEFEIRKTTP